MLSREDEGRERSYQRNGVSQCHFGCHEFCLFSFAVCSVYTASFVTAECISLMKVEMRVIELFRLVKERSNCSAVHGSSVMVAMAVTDV